MYSGLQTLERKRRKRRSRAKKTPRRRCLRINMRGLSLNSSEDEEGRSSMSEEVRGRGSYVAREMGGIADLIRVERGGRVVRSLIPMD